MFSIIAYVIYVYYKRMLLERSHQLLRMVLRDLRSTGGKASNRDCCTAQFAHFTISPGNNNQQPLPEPDLKPRQHSEHGCTGQKKI